MRQRFPILAVLALLAVGTLGAHWQAVAGAEEHPFDIDIGIVPGEGRAAIGAAVYPPVPFAVEAELSAFAGDPRVGRDPEFAAAGSGGGATDSSLYPFCTGIAEVDSILASSGIGDCSTRVAQIALDAHARPDIATDIRVLRDLTDPRADVESDTQGRAAASLNNVGSRADVTLDDDGPRFDAHSASELSAEGNSAGAHSDVTLDDEGPRFDAHSASELSAEGNSAGAHAEADEGQGATACAQANAAGVNLTTC